jgi:hypothetical protein
MTSKICVEPRNKDGSLNVNMIGHKDVKSACNCETYDQLFDVYFSEVKEGDSCSFQQLNSWLSNKGLTVRNKYW